MTPAINPEAVTESQKTVHRHLRGSTLLLAGKGLGGVLNFVTLVLIVRYLGQADYGAFAYALSVVVFLQHFSTLGLRVALPRFIPIYHHHRQHERLLGAISVSVAVTLAASGAMVAAVLAWPEWVTALVKSTDGGHPGALLVILIFLVPAEALDNLLIGLFAGFCEPGSIFFRRYVLAPLLKLGAVLLTMAIGGSAVFLASTHVLAFTLGLLLYLPTVIGTLRRAGVFNGIGSVRLSFPVRELFSFSLPVWGTDLLVGLGPLAAVLLLGYYRGLTEVALLSAILPLARLNRTVRMSFETLYAPSAARLFAQQDWHGLNDLYWRTASWMAVLSFPVFALTFSLSYVLLMHLYGPEYGTAWFLLAVLSAAYYVITALGFSSVTLQVTGHARYVVATDIVTNLVGVALTAALVPSLGAAGAGLGICATFLLQATVKQLGLWKIAGMRPFDPRYGLFYAAVVGLAMLLLALQFFFGSQIVLAGLGAAVASLLVLKFGKRSMNISDTFPELMRWRFARLMFT